MKIFKQILTSILLLYSFINAETFYVPGQFELIQDAINNSSDNDSILVSPGVYNEKINFDPVILRFATAFGASPRMRFDLTINEFAYELLKGNELVVYDPDTWRPYCHVNDFSRLILKILEDKKNNFKFEVYNAGSDENNFTKRQIAELLAKKISGSKIKFKEGDVDPRNYKVDFSKVKKILNFKPKYSVQYGIIEILKALKNKKFEMIKKESNFGNYKI